MTSKFKLYESRSIPLNFHVVSVVQLLTPQNFSNESQSTESVEKFDIFLEYPIEMLVIRTIKHCIQICMFKFSNFITDSKFDFLFFSIESHSAGKVAVNHPKNYVPGP